ncbi:indole-3-glycerol phosphate synthase TrpC [Paenibacillus urinalis]|uniref:Indole-3-glycerol phosphate synthase n=1 Tax=Paenibacillus urinalis TaxID=521520 RepID=A0ABY7X8I9_9BACL|nr:MULTISPECIES: indole-3-glycerol phosphate synthase TrpC [Paenibacillus]WDH97279.1 indole-3-glycerol phosphate synthase TrpC [Paenibacillus urinalis]WDI00942.1 indole-3-glycerol phosphate synthase TrpC [Paenibacillus urinalis]GAK40015.1 Indole-3-glycerol phosphate synthase [Paenibacillus sp. TCA20]
MYLDRIVATKKEEVAALSSVFDINEAEKRIAALPAARGFERALSKEHVRGMGLIAEVKKASPSKGLIRSNFDPVDIAKAYEAAGADCMSVLTDIHYFQGKPEYLTAIRQQVNVPLLRKDFIIDEKQIAEARIIGADAVLLIASILDSAQLSRYISYARDLGLDALVEVHDKEELLSVLDIGSASLIGINNRNLRTFETRLETTAELAELVPEHVTLISESGIRTPQDVEYVKQAGAKGILVGEQFMRQDNVSQAVLELMGAGEQVRK